MHAASLPHFLPSPALASPVGSSPSSQPGIGVSTAPCSTLFVANLGQFVSEHELKEIFSRSDHFYIYIFINKYFIDIFKCLMKLNFLLFTSLLFEKSNFYFILINIFFFIKKSYYKYQINIYYIVLITIINLSSNLMRLVASALQYFRSNLTVTIQLVNYAW